MVHFYSKLKLTKKSNGSFYVSFYIKNKRFRFSDTKALGTNISPNRGGVKERESLAYEMLIQYKMALDSGWSPVRSTSFINPYQRLKELTFPAYLTVKYRKALHQTLELYLEYIESYGLTEEPNFTSMRVKEFLSQFNHSSSVYNHHRKRLHAIISQVAYSSEVNPVSQIRTMREKQEIHKPFANVKEVLKEIKAFNENLYICCLLTYGCLLRPHQEIRNLKWSDFGEDLSYISLSGKRNKSGRNRIVPITESIRENLKRGANHHNIFTGTEEPFAEGYFSLLWRRFKEVSESLSDGQTLYSFRHTGALNVFQKSGSLVKLQQVMGHSDMKVTLTYLRGLEIQSLEVADMPEY